MFVYTYIHIYIRAHTHIHIYAYPHWHERILARSLARTHAQMMWQHETHPKPPFSMLPLMAASQLTYMSACTGCFTRSCPLPTVSLPPTPPLTLARRHQHHIPHGQCAITHSPTRTRGHIMAQNSQIWMPTPPQIERHDRTERHTDAAAHACGTRTRDAAQAPSDAEHTCRPVTTNQLPPPP